MRCIQSHPFFYLLNPQVTEKQQLRTRKHVWFSGNESTSLVLQTQNRQLRTKAFPTSLVLGASSPAKSGDISVFLQTSALLLFAYGIANFVVPSLISKYFQFDKATKAQQSTDGSSLEDEEDSPKTKKRGFNSTKT